MKKIHSAKQLSTAIKKNEFYLVYQPIVDCKDQIVSYEALLRWRTDNTDISPSDFIPALEKTGLIGKVGAWVLEKACKMIAYFYHRAQHISICVNVSLIQLYEKNFVSYVNSLLDSLMIPGDLLHIEITESVCGTDFQLLNEIMLKLKSRGVRFSADDFGTGYSNLSAIHNLCFDYIKIDRSFVKNIDGNGMCIIKAIMDISKSLNMAVIAEGVETKKQRNLLIDYGVAYMQGFYFSAPVKLYDIELS